VLHHVQYSMLMRFLVHHSQRRLQQHLIVRLYKCVAWLYL
jgi:hypothetical protein